MIDTQELLDIAELKELNESTIGESIHIYCYIINKNESSSYSSKAAQALERITTKYGVNIDCDSNDKTPLINSRVKYDLIFSAANFLKVTTIPIIVFSIFGPLFGGHIFSLSPLIFYVYMIGVLPAAGSGALFSIIWCFFILKKDRFPKKNQFIGMACGFTSITIFLLFFIDNFNLWIWIFLEISGGIGGFFSGIISSFLLTSSLKMEKTLVQI